MDQEGKFTGEEITYIYPDLLTGLHGKFRDGEVVEARAVDIVAERCQQGVKEIRLRLRRDTTSWRVVLQVDWLHHHHLVFECEARHELVCQVRLGSVDLPQLGPRPPAPLPLDPGLHLRPLITQY